MLEVIQDKVWDENQEVNYWDMIEFYTKNIKTVYFKIEWNLNKPRIVYDDIDYIQLQEYRQKPSRPLNEQSEKCIEYIYNLVK